MFCPLCARGSTARLRHPHVWLCCSAMSPYRHHEPNGANCSTGQRALWNMNALHCCLGLSFCTTPSQPCGLKVHSSAVEKMGNSSDRSVGKNTKSTRAALRATPMGRSHTLLLGSDTQSSLFWVLIQKALKKKNKFLLGVSQTDRYRITPSFATERRDG